MIRVLIADDEAMIRSALVALLNLEQDLEIVAECVDGTQALEMIQQVKPDVCLLDLEMPGLDGVEVVEHLHKRLIDTKCVVVTRHARPGVLRRALASGVAGFLPKSRGAGEVAQVIRQVANGDRYVDPEIAASALSQEPSPLTARELDVLRAGSKGETTTQIGKALLLAPGTVRNHISTILAKTGARTRQQATDIALENGWL